MIQVSPYIYDAVQAQAAIDYVRSMGRQCAFDADRFTEDRYPFLISFNDERAVHTGVADVLDNPDEQGPSLEAHLTNYWKVPGAIGQIDKQLGYNWGGPVRTTFAKFFEL